MDDCVAAVTTAVAAYRRRKQRMKNINLLTLVRGLLDEEDAIVSRKHICSSLCNMRRTAVLRPRYRLLLDDVGDRLHKIVCMARCGLRAAFMWLCKPETIEHHVLYHATVVNRCTTQ